MIKKDSSASLATWHIQIFQARSSPSNQCAGPTTNRLERLWGVCMPLGWGGLMLMYSQLTSVSIQPGEGQRSCSLAMYHRHGNTPLGAQTDPKTGLQHYTEVCS